MEGGLSVCTCCCLLFVVFVFVCVLLLGLFHFIVYLFVCFVIVHCVVCAAALRDYFEANMTDHMDGPDFAKLMAIEDPINYAPRLTMPKLVCCCVVVLLFDLCCLLFVCCFVCLCLLLFVCSCVDLVCIRLSTLLAMSSFCLTTRMLSVSCVCVCVCACLLLTVVLLRVVAIGGTTWQDRSML